MKNLQRLLPHDPARALHLLPTIQSDRDRHAAASLIAHAWARQDINAAWNAVATSALSHTEKQIMFNVLWG